MTQLAMQCDTIHPYYDAVQFDFNTMRFDGIKKKYDCFYLFGSDWQQIIN